MRSALEFLVLFTLADGTERPLTSLINSRPTETLLAFLKACSCLFQNQRRVLSQTNSEIALRKNARVAIADQPQKKVRTPASDR